jgi:hypothetical protein
VLTSRVINWKNGAGHFDSFQIFGTLILCRISTPTTIASVMGLMGSLFFGIGKGSGCLFGTYMSSLSYICKKQGLWTEEAA